MKLTSDLNTQIVYVLVSSSDDIYLDQFWGSLYSLRRFHPEAKVVVLADSPTARRIKTENTLSPLYRLITELQEVDVPESYNNVLRSRDIKTRVRNLIDGDFFYIDTDTIITAPIDDIDRLEVKNIAMVPDLHRLQLKDNIWDVNRVKMIYGMNVTDSKTTFFNAGVAYVRDNAMTRDFYAKWHENWLVTVKKGYYVDQPGLFYTNNAFGFIIEKLPDIYNCMGAYSAHYWTDARIIHYLDKGLPLRVLKDIPHKIHRAQGITEEVEDLLLNAKSHLSQHTCFCSFYDLAFLNGAFCQFFIKNGWLYRCIKKINQWESEWRVRKLNKWK